MSKTILIIDHLLFIILLASLDKKRILWGLLLAPCVVVFVLFAPVKIFKFFVLLVSAVCLNEFMRLALPKHPSSSPKLGIFLGTFFSGIVLFADQTTLFWAAGLTLILIITFSYYLFCRHDLSIVLSQISLTLFGVVYVGCLFSYIGLLRSAEQGIFWVFLTVGATFMADSGAYFTGHLFGKHKLAPLVSPGKTVEGFIGGIFASVLATFICKLIFWSSFPSLSCLIIGCLIGIIGPLGDLSESLIKRGVNVKDSGQLIPGHGGLLDRVDALLFTAPTIYYYVKFFQ